MNHFVLLTVSYDSNVNFYVFCEISKTTDGIPACRIVWPKLDVQLILLFDIDVEFLFILG